MEKYDQNFSDEDLITIIKWKQLRTIHDFLEFFYDVTLALQGDRMILERVLETLDLLKDHIDEALVYRTIFYFYFKLIIFRKLLRTQRITL